MNNKIHFNDFKEKLLKYIKNSKTEDSKLLKEIFEFKPQIFDELIQERFNDLILLPTIDFSYFVENDISNSKQILEKIYAASFDSKFKSVDLDFVDGGFKDIINDWYQVKNNRLEFKNIFKKIEKVSNENKMKVRQSNILKIKNRKKINVAIDGPSGAGKSSISKDIANLIDYNFISSGQIYRAMAWMISFVKINCENKEEVINYISSKKNEIRIIQNQRIFVQQKDVTNLINNEKIAAKASTISQYKQIREFVVDISQNLAANKGVIMDGRDVGMIILPNAEIKIFLTASLKVRAQRRQDQNIEMNLITKYEDVLENIKIRDYEDANREFDPLIKAKDAIILDTSNLSKEKIVQKIIKMIIEVKYDK